MTPFGGAIFKVTVEPGEQYSVFTAVDGTGPMSLRHQIKEPCSGSMTHENFEGCFTYTNGGGTEWGIFLFDDAFATYTYTLAVYEGGSCP